MVWPIMRSRGGNPGCRMVGARASEVKGNPWLRGCPVEGVDLLVAVVARNQWGVIRRKATPGAEIGLEALHALQAGDLFQFAVSDADAEDAGGVSKHCVEVDELTISRPIGIANRTEGGSGQIAPASGCQIEQDQLVGISGNGGDGLTVWRWTRRKEIFTARQVGDLFRGQIQNRNRSIHVGGQQACMARRGGRVA